MQHVAGSTPPEFTRFYPYVQRIVEEETNKYICFSKEGYTAVSREILLAITQRITRETSSEGRWFVKETRTTRSGTRINAELVRIEVEDIALSTEGGESAKSKIRDLPECSISTFDLEKKETLPGEGDGINICIAIASRQIRV